MVLVDVSEALRLGEAFGKLEWRFTSSHLGVIQISLRRDLQKLKETRGLLPAQEPMPAREIFESENFSWPRNEDKFICPVDQRWQWKGNFRKKIVDTLSYPNNSRPDGVERSKRIS